jgi:Cu(I)/Ag(I) efflux system membrane fusion protein
MKSLIISLVIFFGVAIIAPLNSSAQCGGAKGKGCGGCASKTENKTKSANGVTKETIKVSGACGMCKTRIETAAKSVKGVATASWNQSTGILEYTFNGTVAKTDVSNAIIKVGHDTEFGKTQDVVYNKLPTCCKYRN